MDPITGAIVAFLSAQIPEVGKLAVKDAYNALKAAIRNRFGKSSKVDEAVRALEEEPEFEPNQTALAGRMKQAGAVGDRDLLKLSAALAEALDQSDAGRAALAKYNISIENAEIGVIGDGAHIEGGIHFGKK